MPQLSFVHNCSLFHEFYLAGPSRSPDYVDWQVLYCYRIRTKKRQIRRPGSLGLAGILKDLAVPRLWPSSHTFSDFINFFKYFAGLIIECKCFILKEIDLHWPYYDFVIPVKNSFLKTVSLYQGYS